MVRYVNRQENLDPLRREVADYLLAGSKPPASAYRPLD